MTRTELDTIICQDMESYLWWNPYFRFLGTNSVRTGDIFTMVVNMRTFGYYYLGTDENTGYIVRAIGHVDGKRVYLNKVYYIDHIHNKCTVKTVNKYIQSY